MAWVPKDKQKFKQDYESGFGRADLILRHHGTKDQVDKYIRKAVLDGELVLQYPHRSTVEVAKQTNKRNKEEHDFEEYIDAQIMSFVKVRKSPVSIIELANIFDISPGRVEESIDRLKNNNFTIELHRADSVRLSTPRPGGRTEVKAYTESQLVRYGLVSDAHLGSKYEQLEKLNLMYDIFAERGITHVYDTGNWIDGEARFNVHDIHTHGLDNQIKYWAEHWPKRDGIITSFIAGDDHEGWYTQKYGIDIGAHAERIANEMGREDLIYLGYMEHDLVLPAKTGETRIRLQHPGGGSSYAISYAPQKVIESLSGGEKPHILHLGHWHKSGYFFSRNIHTVLSGCFQAQSPFMRKKRLAAHLGGWIIEFLQADNGEVLEFRPSFIPFYEVDAYADEVWQYQM